MSAKNFMKPEITFHLIKGLFDKKPYKDAKIVFGSCDVDSDAFIVDDQ